MDVKDFEERYCVTPEGKVWSKRSKRFLKSYKTRRGYEMVDLMMRWKKKKFLVHRLVALAYLPNHEKKEQVNHKDGNRNNNHAKNLEWATNQENRDHAISTGLVRPETYARKLSTKQALAIIKEYKKGGTSFAKLGKKYGVNHNTVWLLFKGKNWKHLPR